MSDRFRVGVSEGVVREFETREMDIREIPCEVGVLVMAVFKSLVYISQKRATVPLLPFMRKLYTFRSSSFLKKST